MRTVSSRASTMKWRSKVLSQSGFGLVEILIALALGIAITLGISTLFTDTSRTLSDVTRASQKMESAMYALEIISNDVSQSGYWGEAGALTVADLATKVFFSGEDISAPPTGVSLPPNACAGTGNSGAKTELGYAMAYPLLGQAGSLLTTEIDAGLCGGYSPAVDPNGTSEFVAVRRASTCAVGSDRCRALDDFFHLQVNGCNNATGSTGGTVKLYRVNTSDYTSLLNYTDFNCSAAAPIYRYVSNIYYADANDDLVLLFLDISDGSFTYTAENIAQGIELIRFQWFVDNAPTSPGDGKYDRVTTSPSEDDWEDVVAVKVWIVARDLTPEAGYTDSNTYTIAGNSWSVPAANVSYRRTVQSKLIELANIGGPRR